MSSLGLIVALAFIPASFLAWCVTGGFKGASMLGWNPGGMQNEKRYSSPVFFWQTN